MAKPTIVTRAGKGSALTWTEGDANLTNLQDATITVTDGTNSKAIDLNGTITFTGGTNISTAVNATTGEVTITNTASAGATTLDGLSDVVITAAATNDVLVYNGTNWVDTSADTLTVSAASTATNATNINISTTTGNTNDTTLYPVMVAANATGNQAPHIDGVGFAFNATTNTITLGSSSANSVGALALNTASAAFSVTIQAPTLSASYTLTLPTNDGSASGLLQTDGSGTLTWSNAINSTSIGATTASTGTFTTMTAATAILDDIRETVAALTYGATITPNAADGSIRTITLTGNVTFSAFTSPVSGQTITLIITQDGTGSRTLTSTMKFAGGSKTLSTAANAIDILTVSYIGTTYYASLVKGYA